MKREQILENVFKEFTTYGIKRVSVDSIAQNLRISKKTIYEQFDNKENLLEEALEYKLREFTDALKESASRQPDILHAMITAGVECFRFLNELSPAFYHDLEYFPLASDKFEKLKERLLLESAMRFRQGVEDGFFKPGQNYEIVSRLFLAHITAIRIFGLDKYTPAQTCRISLMLLLKGVATEKGYGILEQMEKKDSVLSMAADQAKAY